MRGAGAGSGARSVQNKKIHFLSKKNQALKMENEGLARMSMSPMVTPMGKGVGKMQRTPPASAAAESPSGTASKQEAKARKDSPTIMGEFRKKLDNVLAEHDSKNGLARATPRMLAHAHTYMRTGTRVACGSGCMWRVVGHVRGLDRTHARAHVHTYSHTHTQGTWRGF
jgi:hypothetical protein